MLAGYIAEENGGLPGIWRETDELFKSVAGLGGQLAGELILPGSFGARTRFLTLRCPESFIGQFVVAGTNRYSAKSRFE